MKKKFIPLLILPCLLLTGCELLNPIGFLSGLLGGSESSESGDSSQGSGSGEYSADPYDHSDVTVGGLIPYTPHKDEVRYTYKDLVAHNVYPIDRMPSTGNTKVLVIPVWFSNSTDYMTTGTAGFGKRNRDVVRSDISKTFFGESDDTGWESVASYYEKASYGKLHISGAVTGWYSVSNKATYYDDSQKTNALIKSAVQWAKESYGPTSQYPIDFSEYDSDRNGYLDCVCVIYGYHNSNYQTGFFSPSKGNDNLWAYTFWYQDPSHEKNVSNPGLNTFLWASYDFMYPGEGGGSNIDRSKLDAHTYIHELGHCMGLEDYYDYNDNNNLQNCASGAFSMQDYNVGDHEAFSKMALGWTTPYVPTNDCTITINDFESSGDCILLSPNYVKSSFDEFILIDFYTPTGLNQADSSRAWSSGYPYGLTSSGIRIWHIDSRLMEYHGYPTATSKYNIAKTIRSSGYYYTHATSNTTYSSSFKDYAAEDPGMREFKILQLIRNSGTATNKYGAKGYVKNSDLFMEGDTFSISQFYKQFDPNKTASTIKLNNGLPLPFEVSVQSISTSEHKATITIDVTA